MQHCDTLLLDFLLNSPFLYPNTSLQGPKVGLDKLSGMFYGNIAFISEPANVVKWNFCWEIIGFLVVLSVSISVNAHQQQVLFV